LFKSIICIFILYIKKYKQNLDKNIYICIKINNNMNPYEILGVDKNASADQIKKAYRKLSKEHHPDVGGDENKFKEIASAYDTLSNPEKKQQFDNFGSGGNPFGGGGFGGFEDFISQMFNGGGNPFQRQRARRGNDAVAHVQMSLIDIIKGANKKITYTKDDKCDTCDGKGGESADNCGTCNGTGQVIRQTQTPMGIMQQVHTCPNCHGNGKIIKNPCNKCNGSGAYPKVIDINVTIPAGVHNGQQLSMPGGGNYVRDGIAGDLTVVIQEIADENFKREITEGRITNNLRSEIWINISEAVLGTSKIVKAPLGDLKFSIEPGCESGKVYAFNGKGIPNVLPNGQSNGSGNLYVKVNVTIPKKLTEETKSLFEKLKDYEN